MCALGFGVRLGWLELWIQVEVSVHWGVLGYSSSVSIKIRTRVALLLQLETTVLEDSMYCGSFENVFELIHFFVVFVFHLVTGLKNVFLVRPWEKVLATTEHPHEFL